MGLLFDGEDLPLEILRWKIAERFGWTLETVDNMKVSDLHEMLHVDDGQAKVNKSLLKG